MFSILLNILFYLDQRDQNVFRFYDQVLFALDMNIKIKVEMKQQDYLFNIYFVDIFVEFYSLIRMFH